MTVSMANKKMNLTGTGKEILESLCDYLEVERPLAIKIALAKGLAKSEGQLSETYKDNKQKWIIPDNIIRDKEYLLFKHLIINELENTISEDQLDDHFLSYIEYGLRIIQEEIENISSIEDYRIKILN